MAQGSIDINGRAELVEPLGRNFVHITTNATTVAKTGPGTLHDVIINTKGATHTATLYDNTAGSGTVIAVIDTTSLVTMLEYAVSFSIGLTIVTAGTTPADITVTYR